MEQMLIPELEKAANILNAPPQAVTAKERRAAEHIFLEFRKTKQPYNLCRLILENCHDDYVLFESASTLKEAVIREWNFLHKQDLDNLCTFLLSYVTHQKSLQKFVREQILQVVAIIVKRGTLDKSKEGCGDLLKNVGQLLHTGDKEMQMICGSIMKALMTEYSSTSQSSNLGLSLEYHAECKKAFEDGNLLTVFHLSTDILKKYTDDTSSSLSRIDTAIFIRYLSLAEQVLNWNFLTGNPLQLLRMSNETAKITLFRPPKNWQSTIMDPIFIALFFKLYERCSGHEELTHHCLQCLIQLGSMTGPIFLRQPLRTAYLTYFIQGFSQLMNRNTWTPLEAFGYASIVSRIVNVFPISVISSLQAEVLKSFSEILAVLTCSFLELADTKEEMAFDSNQYEEALDLLLDAWVVLVSNSSCFPEDYFMSHAVQIFNGYLKTHLAKPDGIRVDNVEDNEIGEIDCDVEEDDRIAYSDELSDIGCLARLALPHVLPTLSTLISSRSNTLLAALKIEGANLHALFEDIHWLLLITTNVLTMDCNNVKSSIPSEILQFELQQQRSRNVFVQSSLTYMSNLGRNCDESKVSSVVILISEILKLAEYICEAVKGGLSEKISPEIASDVLWFLQSFSSSYLFLSEKNNDIAIPDVFKSTFGGASPCATQLISTILNIAETNLMCLSAEPEVTKDGVQLLLKLFAVDERISAAMNFPNLWRLAEQHSKIDSQLQKLPVDVNRNLVQALMKAGSHLTDVALREKFMTAFLGKFQVSYNAIRKHPNFRRISQEGAVRQGVMSLIESMRGITLATDSKNIEMVFQFLLPYLEDIPSLLEVFANCAEMVELIFELFVDVVQTEIVYLEKEKSNVLCGLCVQLIVNYSEHNSGRIRAMKFGEDESYQEILLLIRLLTHILSKDYLDFSDLAVSSDGAMLNAVDAVFHGLYIIIPLMSEELLKFPKLNMEYFKLVTFVCECYPEKIEQLPEDLFGTLSASLEMALSHFGADVAKDSYEALASIGKHCFKLKSQHGCIIAHLDRSLLHFLKIVFEQILSPDFDMDLLQPASETLFTLICCNQEEYMNIAQNLLSTQEDPGILERLRVSFADLTPSTLTLSVNKSTVAAFRKNLEKFLLDVKGFLFMK